ncbi:MAG: site-2 protease family protein [Polyangiaceae bacterium]
MTEDREKLNSRGTPPRSERGLLGLLGGLSIFALSKLKALLLLLKALPAGKVLLTSGSMLLMVLVEARRSGLLFGIGFVALILVHELGHGYAMKKHGVAAGWPIFIPFFGAMIAMKGAPRDRDIEAEIAFGGPYAGTMASLLVAAIGLYAESRLLLSLAYFGFFLNLFNLTPISPLDGGRIVQAFSKRAWVVGLIAIVGLLVFTGTPQLVLILVMALPQLFRKEERQRIDLDSRTRQSWAVRYFGLCAFAALAIFFTGKLLHH